MVYDIDGTRFWTLEEFFAEFNRVLVPGSDVFREQSRCI